MGLSEIGKSIADPFGLELVRFTRSNHVMDFELTPDQQTLQKAAIEFARRELNGNMIERDAQQVFSHDGWKKCAAFGVQWNADPQRVRRSRRRSDYNHRPDGRPGLRPLRPRIAVRYQCTYVDQFDPAGQIRHGRTEEEYPPGLCDGSLIGANGASEPSAGSDIFSMQTRVRKDGSDYVLNGRKIFATNGPVADLFTLCATLDPQLGAVGICGFVIEKETPALRIGKKKDKMGLRTALMAELALENCRVPGRALLGREGRGVEVFNCSMAWERACILATCLGTMRRQLERCVEYARKRKQFGQPIGKFQSVANHIVDMKLRYETARLLIYKVGWLMEGNKSADMDAAMAKLYVSESFVNRASTRYRYTAAQGS
jgi:alkylation response protein AidB-like acyl-CoA dehydrogenase